MMAASTDIEAAFLLPVGHDHGPRLAGDEGTQPRFQVRVGSRMRELDNPGYATWLLAHDGDNMLPDRTTIVDAAVSLGLSKAQTSTALDALLGDGLLVEVGADGAAPRQFAETHQLVSLMLGLGPDEDEPGIQVVGLLDTPVIQVSDAMYDIWLWAQLEPNLWEACLTAAETARHAGASNPAEVEPDRVLSALLPALHPLLASRAAFLDTVPAARDAGTAVA